MQICAQLPMGASLYKLIQKRVGRLNADPMKRLSTQIEMSEWLHKHNLAVENRTFFEVGTGHKPIAPIGFFLSGAASVVTIDLHRRLDWKLTSQALQWICKHRQEIEAKYVDVVNSSLLNERLNLIEQFWSAPEKFFKVANIQYLAPSDAARTGLPTASVDYHFSITTLEHIPQDVIKNIFIEAKRILAPDGVAIHFIDPSDHFQHQDHSITRINFLQFTEQEWMRIAGNEFAYCNRLRASDYLSLFSSLEFKSLQIEQQIDSESLNQRKNGFRVDPQFQTHSHEDVCTTNLRIMLRLANNEVA